MSASASNAVVEPFTFATATAIESSSSYGDLRQVADQAFTELGGDIYACLELQVQIHRPDVKVCFGRITPDWKAAYCESGCLADDPLIALALGSNEPASWSDVDPAALDAVEQRSLEEGRRLGFSGALITPQHGPRGVVGAVLVMSRSFDAPSPFQRFALTMLSSAVDRAARKLRLCGLGRSGPHPGLTRREAEALYWAANGAKDKEIAVAMAISLSTATGYVHVAQKKLGVSGRILAARRAVELNLLPSFVRSSTR